MSLNLPPVVIDMGSGFTKMGLAGNLEPEVVMPTCVTKSTKKSTGVHLSHSNASIPELDFFIGEEAYRMKDSANYTVSWPVVKGRIDNWDDTERLLQHAIYRQLRCTPNEHKFLLTETPFNSPENRERTAEMMFETFNVKGLNISVQAVLALFASNCIGHGSTGTSAKDLTGLVVDAGDGSAHTIPIVNGFVISSNVQEIPLGGRHVTEFINNMLRDRQEPVPAEQRMNAARTIKEQHCYVSKNPVEEFQKFDQDSKKWKSLSGVAAKNKEPWTLQISYERFLAPEIFFNPEIFSSSVTTPLPEMVDSCIRKCPIDCRRQLYGNIVLAGGSTIFTHFAERLNRDVQDIVDERMQQSVLATGRKPEQPISVLVEKVKKKAHQRYAAWLGGSFLASAPEFANKFKSKADYEECGPSIMRNNAVVSEF